MPRRCVLTATLVLIAGCAPVAASSVDDAARLAALPRLVLRDEAGQVVTVGGGADVAVVEGIVAMDDRTIVPATAAPPGLAPVVASPRAGLVAHATAPTQLAPGTIAAGRTTSRVVVTATDGRRWDVTLDGNVVPEAFSSRPKPGEAPQLYAVEYLPADAPQRYRVRVLDLGTGELSWPRNLRFKAPVDTEMAGVSRDQVVASRRGLLFTLYRGRRPGDDHDYAFVHVLSASGGVWCLGVPNELRLDRSPGVVAVSPDESTLYVASAAGGLALYEIDVILDGARSPDASVVVTGLPSGERGPALGATAAGPILAQGNDVVWLEAEDLSVTQRATAEVPVEALTVASGGRVVVAGDGRLQVVAPGSTAAPVELPAGVTAVTKLLPG